MALYSHNVPTFMLVYYMLQTYGECALDQATGTGKTFITMQLLTTIFKEEKVLYVVPTLTIADAIQLYDDWTFDNVTFTTYSNLKSYGKGFTVLILDELHRAGAPTWEREVLRMKGLVKWCLGLSATPLRFLDKRRNMAQELFNNHCVHGPDISAAIEQGILSGFDYYAILTETYDIVEEIRNYNPSRELIDRIGQLHLDDYCLGDRIRSHIGEEHQRCIVFYPDNLTLQKANEDLIDWFGSDVKIFQVHSGQSKAVNRQNIQQFNASNGRCVIKAIDMLNEGVHVEDVTLLIFARKTVSGNVFLQQIGRALSASSKRVRPCILDLVGNYKNIREIGALLSKRVVITKKIGEKQPQSEILLGKVLICYDEVLLELEDILAKVKGTWSDAEDAILRKYWNLEGVGVVKRLSGKSESSCRTRAKLLGLTRNRRWTNEEDAIIREHYIHEREAIYKRLPGRTYKAITDRATALGVICKWLPEEELVIMRYWDTERYTLLNRLPRHTLKEIYDKAAKLGLSQTDDIDKI